MRLSPKKREKWLQQARDDLRQAYEAESYMRPEMIDDLRFSFAQQWDDQIQQERDQQNRPCEVFDRLGDMIRKAMRNIRMNRPSIKVLPVEAADAETAEIFTDLIREIEYASGGSGPYLWGVESAIRCGFGVWEVCEHDSESDVWNQDLRIKRAANPFVYYFDPNSRHPVKADMQFCIKSSYYTDEEFKAKWPKARTAGQFDTGMLGETRELWYADGKNRVAKVWRRFKVRKTLMALSDGRVVYEDELTEDDAALEVLKTREVDTWEVYRWVQSGFEFLEKPQRWPGKYIPCVPCYGEEMNIEGQISYRGLVRTAKGPQRMYNFARNTQLEILAQQPKAPWLLGLSQLPDDDKMASLWARANDAKLPFLPFDDSRNPNPPQRNAPPAPSNGFLAEAAQAADDVQRATGMFDAALGAPSNELSGRAILARQMGGDDGVLVFADNLAASIEQTGRILVDLIPHYYDAERVIRLRGEDDTQREVQINAPEIVFDPQEGVKRVIKHDLTRGKYDVRIQTGPGYATRMLEASDSMLAFLQQFPQAAPFVADLVAKNQSWPQAEEFAQRLRALVPPGVIEEDDPEKQQAQMMAMQQAMQQAQRAAEAQEADTMAKRARAARDIAAARGETIEAEEDRMLRRFTIQKAEADAVKAEAEAEKAAMETLEMARNGRAV